MSDELLRLTVLGCATPYPQVGNPCSGYLVSHGGTHVWVDAGTGTLGELRRYVQLDELDAIWISHMHADHTSDLLTAYYGAQYADVQLAAPIPLFGPAGIGDRLADYLTNSEVRSQIGNAFAIEELSDGHEAKVGTLTLTSRAVTHGMPAFAVRIEAESGDKDGEGGHEETSGGAGSLVYSGDAAPCDSLTSLAEGCDVLLCEAGDDQPPAADGYISFHHTPEDAGATAAAVRAGRLIVTHLNHRVSAEQAVARASSRYDGPVECAAPGASYAIGSGSGRR
ncbi:MAG TPA: MBL fold metallo-hydrolase [Actinocrinis sp.]|nr:MBL fold metallo-hydrolase [Actinocrinis sp.]